MLEIYHDVFLDNALGMNLTPTYLETARRGDKLYLYSGTPQSLSIAIYDPAARTLRPSNYSQVQRNLPREFVPADYRGDWDWTILKE